MKRFIFLSSAILLNLLLVSDSVQAAAPYNPADYSYQFHLYYDQSGRLVTDRDFLYSYDIVVQPYENSVASSVFKATIKNMEGKSVAEFPYALVAGKNAVTGPYHADAAQVEFYRDSALLLSVSVQESSFCNNDKVCNSDVGEDSVNCPSDCAAAPSSAPASSHTGLFILIGSGGIIVLAGLGVWYRSKKNQIPPVPPVLPSQPA